MYGFQSFPTNKKKLRLDLFNFFKKKRFNSGYADHTRHVISNELINTCKFIVYDKCKYLEKHVCIDLKRRPIDYETSINIKDFNLFIKKIKKKNTTTKFKYARKRSLEEIKYFLKMHKFAFVIKKINKGSEIKLSDIKFYRSDSNKEGLTKLDFYKNKIITKKRIIKNKQVFRSLIL